MISVVIPVYNQASELDVCLKSISKQTYASYEVIVIDDGSSDDVFRVIKKYKEVFGVNLEFLENDKNMGAPYTRNRGAKNAKGEFVIFCDADSYLEPEMLEKMAGVLKSNPEVSYVFSSFLWGHKKFALEKFSAEKLRSMPYIHSNSLIRRDHFPKSGWDESIKKLQDWDLWLTMLDEGHVGFWVDEVLFRIKPSGIYSNWLPSFCYKIFPFLPSVKKYKRAVEIVKKKHNII